MGHEKSKLLSPRYKMHYPCIILAEPTHKTDVFGDSVCLDETVIRIGPMPMPMPIPDIQHESVENENCKISPSSPLDLR